MAIVSAASACAGATSSTIASLGGDRPWVAACTFLSHFNPPSLS
jgi:hypothetical protein